MKRMVFWSGLFAVSFGAQTAGAQILDKSLRPVVRPAVVAPLPVIPVVTKAEPRKVDGLVRPRLRPERAPSATVVQPNVSDAGFERWVDDFKQRAQGQGIATATLARAFQDVRLDPDVIRLDGNQSEFTKTIWQYLDSAASERRIANGKAALFVHRNALDAIERRYGVEKEVVVAVWGLESGYGAYRGSNDVVRSLSTLAYEGRRGAFFEEQLIAALKILQNGDTNPRNMTGSWAGAMGHTQFMPTSFLDHAVDFTGDGKRDIWSEDPTDALASTAAYLKNAGWIRGQPWGIEVTLPRGFDYAQANRKTKKSPGDWARLGVRDMDGRPVDNFGDASILLPAGAQGAAFMIFDNFAAIERYNAADAYVIGVGHLSDRINGAGPIRSSWPTDARALTLAERKEIQERLTQSGFDTQGVDGRIGPNTIDAIRSFQQRRGLTADGYPSYGLLTQLRG